MTAAQELKCLNPADWELHRTQQKASKVSAGLQALMCGELVILGLLPAKYSVHPKYSVDKHWLNNGIPCTRYNPTIPQSRRALISLASVGATSGELEACRFNQQCSAGNNADHPDFQGAAWMVHRACRTKLASYNSLKSSILDGAGSELGLHTSYEGLQKT
ncbi:hypothetical protein PV04_09373 [Phialophora macrospora]|uniref:Uncharacterized protein n=1 Tax=Phialophora macrospora TaxID=1851006 RepID=A0A0D2CGZ7_9EURO|nr:hypothetical protein PV04_09373 [Phialophora macrospora]